VLCPRLAAWVVGALLLVTACARAPEGPGSAVLIVIDTVRADHLGSYGYARPTSPALDRWAERGAVFERALASSSWTLPSVGSMLTGQLPSRHEAGVVLAPGLGWKRDRFARLDDSVPTLAQRLDADGYATAAVVNNAALHADFGLARGFETWDYFPATDEHNRSAAATVDLALAWLDRSSDQPFFLLVHFFDPHLAYDPPEPARGRFSGDYTGALGYPVHNALGLRLAVDQLDADDRRFVADAYDEELLALDGELGRLLDGMAERGLLETTLVVLTSDHGEELFDHGGFEHGHSTFQELLHVPLMAWGPGVRAGRIEAPVSHVDLLPTLLDALGRPLPADLAGVSLWPLLRGGSAPPERMLVAEGLLYGADQRAVVRWPWKLVLRADGGQTGLFDLSADPGERHDLSAERPEVLARLQTEPAARLPDGEQLRARTRAAELDEQTRGQLRSLGYVD
jgi:arylsulfatase A-like enzyme